MLPPAGKVGLGGPSQKDDRDDGNASDEEASTDITWSVAVHELDNSLPGTEGWRAGDP
jgi:hypothetical protein